MEEKMRKLMQGNLKEKEIETNNLDKKVSG
jgi:hypothetical protein